MGPKPVLRPSTMNFIYFQDAELSRSVYLVYAHAPNSSPTMGASVSLAFSALCRKGKSNMSRCVSRDFPKSHVDTSG